MTVELSHNIVCPAPAERVYALLTDPAGWPEILTPCQAVLVRSATATTQTVEMTMAAGPETVTWVSERELRPEFYGVEEVQRRPMPLVERIHTSWRVVGLNKFACVLLAEHTVELTDDNPEAADRLRAMIHRNVAVALADYRAAAHRHMTPLSQDAMPDNRIRHTVWCESDADAVYRIVCDTSAWPQLFEACVDVDILRIDGETTDVRVWAMQDGRRVSWDTRRTHHPDLRRVDYQLLVPMPFVAEMAGQWRVIAVAPDRCLLVVDRWWSMLDDVTGIRDGIDTVSQAAHVVRSYVDTNAGAEMRVIADRVAVAR
ncbi:SRPBCC family protein [Nocardia sp. NPDC051570]|uniref:SRPBCC family protein n=1 Tax=Nocardia sp. NPDC051570 TaxID=3364324 RepID=UPI00378CE461